MAEHTTAGTEAVARGMAEQLQGGVISAPGGTARMGDPPVVQGLVDATLPQGERHATGGW